jgi:hypothetical protein
MTVDVFENLHPEIRRGLDTLGIREPTRAIARSQGALGRRASQRSPRISYAEDLIISLIARTATPAAGQLSRTNTTTKQTKGMHCLITAPEQLLYLRQLKQNSIKTVSEQYQTTLKTDEKTQQNLKCNEKSKRNTSSKGHRGGVKLRTRAIKVLMTTHHCVKWSPGRDSNPRPTAYKAAALATELPGRNHKNSPTQHISYPVPPKGAAMRPQNHESLKTVQDNVNWRARATSKRDFTASFLSRCSISGRFSRR